MLQGVLPFQYQGEVVGKGLTASSPIWPYRETPEGWRETGQDWADVNFVPNWIGHKSSPGYRCVAIREPVRHGVLDGEPG